MQSDSGIVLSTVRFSDTKIIAKIYSKKQGILSLMIHSNAGRKKSIKSALLIPLTEINFDLKVQQNASIHSPKEIQLKRFWDNAYQHPIKNCQLIFLNEVLIKTLKEEHPNEDIYDFLVDTFLLLNYSEFNADLHLVFMLEFAKFLGFYPDLSTINQGNYFDLLNGVFLDIPPPHPNYCDKESTECFKFFLSHLHGVPNTKILKNEQRKLVLEILTLFYSLHIPGLNEFKSIRVLEQLF